MTHGRRRAFTLLLTAGIILDGIFMSSATISGESVVSILRSVNSLYYLLFMEASLWAACLNHWLTNVYWIEFREHGILTHARYYPWPTITRIGWSPAHPQRLFLLHSGRFEEMTIDPASRAEVDRLLKHARPSIRP